MMKRILEITRPGHVPFILGLLFIFFSLLYGVVGLPSPSELVEVWRDFYLRFGTAAILVSALVEGLFMINFYFPGSFVIVLAVLLSDRSLGALASIAAASWIGFMMATAANYVLGRYGFYKAFLWLGKPDTIERMRNWLNTKGRWGVPLAAVHPNVLAIAIVCAGIANVQPRRVLATVGVALTFWGVFWTTATATIASQVDIENPNQHWYIFGMFLLWGLFLIVRTRLRDRAG